MNPINHFEQNRPVHLARRDVYFEKGAEAISDQRLLGPDVQADTYDEILFFLRTARDHARAAIRNSGKNGKDEQFSLFINMLAGNVKAVLSMIKLKNMIEDSDESSFGFLGVNQASAGLQAEEYQRRANDIVRSIQKTLKLAEDPFEKLKAENRTASTKEENLRYEKARNHFMQLVRKGRTFTPPPSVRKFMRFFDRSTPRT